MRNNMVITKILCKYFDDEDKGYVTIEDIVKKVFSFNTFLLLLIAILFTILVAMLLYIIGDFYYNGFSTSSDVLNLHYFMAGFSIVFSITAIIIIMYTVYQRVKTYKVVVCPLKENKD
jgi:uncharacterized BrkB/YihY/UPF0761 family membrane protein